MTVGSGGISDTGEEDAGDEEGVEEEGEEDLGLRVMKGMWASIRSCRGCEKGAGEDESASSWEMVYVLGIIDARGICVARGEEDGKASVGGASLVSLRIRM